MSQRPFRDRVLHLLALRPYRKAELLLRLQKDGLAQADKDALDSLLQQVRAAQGGAWGTFTVRVSSPHNCRLAGSGCSMGDPRL